MKGEGGSGKNRRSSLEEQLAQRTYAGCGVLPENMKSFILPRVARACDHKCLIPVQALSAYV
jgi:hypothetical protein